VVDFVHMYASFVQLVNVRVAINLCNNDFGTS